MKTIGLLGGMSWESTATYYEALNKGIKQALGGLNSAQICLYSVNFKEIADLQARGDWKQAAQALSKAALNIENGGADFLMICTNTMHKVASEIEDALSIPVLHIADATARQLQLDGISTVGLLGTKFTMEQDFYKSRLVDNFGIDVVIPELDDRDHVHQIIFDELCQGIISSESKSTYLAIIDDLVARGAQAVILGCTEIGLLVEQSDTNAPLYDTTTIHAHAGITMALK